jgi:hypothetical protein
MGIGRADADAIHREHGRRLVMLPTRSVMDGAGAVYLAVFRHHRTYVIPDTAANSEAAVWEMLLDRYGGTIQWLRRQGFDAVEDSTMLRLAPAFPW